MDARAYWDNYYKKKDEEEWADQPSLFAQFSLIYFPKEGKLLEFGAGAGSDSRYFADHGYQVTCTDYSKEALNIAQWEAVNKKLRIDHMLLDLTQPFPFENESFEIAFSHDVLHYFDNKKTRQIFEEIYRILKPEGILATLLKSHDDPERQSSTKLDDTFYKTPRGLDERFFTVNEVQSLIKDLFEPKVLNSTGQMIEKDNDTFIRFIGEKIIK